MPHWTGLLCVINQKLFCWKLFEREMSCKKGAELCQFFDYFFSFIGRIHHLLKIVEDFTAKNIDNSIKTKYFCYANVHINHDQRALFFLWWTHPHYIHLVCIFFYNIALIETLKSQEMQTSKNCLLFTKKVSIVFKERHWDTINENRGVIC